MKQISEQELKDILSRHDKWLKNEIGGKKANLSFADLRSANLRFANLSSANLRFANLSFANLSFADLRSANLSFADLSSANLRSANLRSANLSSANLRSADLRSADLRSADLSSANLRSADLSSANLSSANLLIFQMQRHQAFYTFDGTLQIGCLVMPISEWLIGFEEIGKSNNYSRDQIEAYGDFIKLCARHFERNNPK